MKNSFLTIPLPCSRPMSTGSTRYHRGSIDKNISLSLSKDHGQYNFPFHTGSLGDTSPKVLKSFYNQELTRLDKQLDSHEISMKNSHKPIISFECYHNYLKDLAISIKKKDPGLSGRILRAIIGYEKALKQMQNNKEIIIRNNSSHKETRENITQTLEGDYLEEDLYPDTLKETQFVKGLIGKIDKLRGPKIMNRLYDLHENLLHLNTDIPTPTKTPEPVENTFNVMDQKMSIFLKVLKTEVKRNLSKNNVVINTADKCIQAVINDEEGFFSDPVKEKILEIANLRNRLHHMEKELEYNMEVLAKTRSSLMHSDRRVEEMKLEVIQLSNKLFLSEDSSKSAKHKLTTVKNDLAIKNEKKSVLKRQLNEKEKMLSAANEIIKTLKEQHQKSSMLCKTAEEKLFQIESSWKSLKGSDYIYKIITAFDITAKYNLIKSNMENSSQKDQDISRTFRRTTTSINSGKIPKFSAQVASKIVTQKSLPMSEEVPSTPVGFNPLVGDDIMFNTDEKPQILNQPGSGRNNYSRQGMAKELLSTIEELSPLLGNDKNMI